MDITLRSFYLNFRYGYEYKYTLYYMSSASSDNISADIEKYDEYISLRNERDNNIALRAKEKLATDAIKQIKDNLRNGKSVLFESEDEEFIKNICERINNPKIVIFKPTFRDTRAATGRGRLFLYQIVHINTLSHHEAKNRQPRNVICC